MAPGTLLGSGAADSVADAEGLDSGAADSGADAEELGAAGACDVGPAAAVVGVDDPGAVLLGVDA